MKKGFTILELLVASLLLGMLVTILTMIFNQSSIAWRTGTAVVEDLGDVRESARVYINDVYAGCAWSAPFEVDATGVVREGTNTLRIEVTNLPANRIADYDRRGIKWRKMEEINVVDINYRRTTYDQWNPVPSGLNSPVSLVILSP